MLLSYFEFFVVFIWVSGSMYYFLDIFMILVNIYILKNFIFLFLVLICFLVFIIIFLIIFWIFIYRCVVRILNVIYN